MNLSEICIRRPVFATVLSLVVLLVGIISYDRLTVREYPKIDVPTVSVETTYRGASPEIIESQVTKPLEEELGGIEGLDYVTSISREERSQISLRFDLDRDPDAAAAEVRDRVSRARGQLPDEIEEPIIRKVEADAEAIMFLTFFGETLSPMDITDFADRFIKDRLQVLPGVAQVLIYGERQYSMRLWLDPAKLAAYNLTVQDVEDAVRRQNVEIPAGRVESNAREFTVLAETDLQTPEQFEAIIIKQASGYPVRLRDVGRAEYYPREDRVDAHFNFKPVVTYGIVKQSVANPLDVAAAVKAELPAIRAMLPEGIEVAISNDKSVFISESIKNVWHTIGEAVVLVIVIIFFFLRSFRATLVPLVTIPVSLIGAFSLMYLFGFSINTLTLLAMVLAIGLVVDDAIVMLENIFRHVEEGMPPFKAAIKGAREISFAIVAMTITLAAVYVPIGFMSGKTGRLFTEFALALAGAVLISGFVALTLSPMMCSKLLKHETKHNFLYMLIERLLVWSTNLYRTLLRGALAMRPLVLLVGLAVAGFGYLLFTSLPSELAPIEDQGLIAGAFISPEGSTPEYTAKYGHQIEKIIHEAPEVENAFVVSGFPIVSNGFTFITLKHWDERERSSREINAELMPKLFAVPGVLAFSMLPPPLGQNHRDKAVQFVLQTTMPYAELDTLASQIMDRMRSNPGIKDLDSDLKLNKPQLKIQVDREKASDLGVPVEVVGRTLETMLGGREVTRFKREGEQYDVLIQTADEDRTRPNQLYEIYVRSADGAMVPLSNLVTFGETVAPRELNHFNQLRSATITANVNEGYTLGQALADFEQAAAEVLPASVQVDYAGQSRDFKESSAGVFVTFVLALAFIYLVLAAQFESFVDPFIIMFTVPLSITGGLLALKLSGGTLNIYSQVGLVTLIGLITKHGILIVDFANRIRIEENKDIPSAAIDAAVLRLRPILMTTGAMVLGAVPLATASGAGAEARQDIGWVIVGGLLVGTFFTLFVIPAVYTYLARRGRRVVAEQLRALDEEERRVLEAAE